MVRSGGGGERLLMWVEEWCRVVRSVEGGVGGVDDEGYYWEVVANGYKSLIPSRFFGIVVPISTRDRSIRVFRVRSSCTAYCVCCSALHSLQLLHMGKRLIKTAYSADAAIWGNMV